jgi:glutamyl-tRNA synthetase
MTEHLQSIVTRFAPSPTGYLHVGGARTALFNWAYARRHGGRFILRIEDTDQLRSSDESTRKIIEDLAWLGIEWDEGPDPRAANPKHAQIGEHGPYFQSQRLDLYRECVQRLLDRKLAYEAFETAEELAARREAVVRTGGAWTYDRTAALGLSPEQIRQFKAEGRPCVVRFRVPDKTYLVEDQILGTVSVAGPEIGDFVIWKADGFPTYHFAVVVDDILMGVTDVMRGQEHLLNTVKHLALYEGLGAAPPRYAHLPLIFNPDGSKMSKRDKAKAARESARQWLAGKADGRKLLAAAAGLSERDCDDFMQKRNDDVATAAAIAGVTGARLPEIDIHDFRASGYLPEALVNYLALLGWSPKDDSVQVDAATLVRMFDIGGIGRSPARFDRTKLLTVNAEAIRALPQEEFCARLRAYFSDFFPEYVQTMTPEQFEYFCAAYQVRARTLAEPAESGRFFVAGDAAISYDAPAAQKALTTHEDEGVRMLRAVLPALQQAEPWTPETLGEAIEETIQAQGVGLGKLGQPLRAAISGGTVTPPLFETLMVLGKERVIARVEQCLRAFGEEPFDNV